MIWPAYQFPLPLNVYEKKHDRCQISQSPRFLILYTKLDIILDSDCVTSKECSVHDVIAPCSKLSLVRSGVVGSTIVVH